MRILLVEDDVRISNFVSKGLRENAYAVDISTDGIDALFQASINNYDIIILDVMLPRKNGFEVCRELRSDEIKTPVLMQTEIECDGLRQSVAVTARITGSDLGMLPLALAIGAGSELLQPLAIAVIGGLAFALFLSLIITPAIFAFFYYDANKIN